MAFVFTTLSDWAFDQVLSFTSQNILKDNQQNIHDSFSVEHNFADGVHTNIRQATDNEGSPDANGGGIVFIERIVAAPVFSSGVDTFTVVRVDDSIDWRDRRMIFLGWGAGVTSSVDANKLIAGGAEDDNLWGGIRDNLGNNTVEVTPTADSNSLDARTQGDISATTGYGGAVYAVNPVAYCYAESGHSESVFPTAVSGPHITIEDQTLGAEAVNLSIFASASDGDLVLMFTRGGGADVVTGDYYVVHGILIYGSDEGIV